MSDQPECSKYHAIVILSRSSALLIERGFVNRAINLTTEAMTLVGGLVQEMKGRHTDSVDIESALGRADMLEREKAPIPSQNGDTKYCAKHAKHVSGISASVLKPACEKLTVLKSLPEDADAAPSVLRPIFVQPPTDAKSYPSPGVLCMQSSIILLNMSIAMHKMIVAPMDTAESQKLLLSGCNILQESFFALRKSLESDIVCLHNHPLALRACPVGKLVLHTLEKLVKLFADSLQEDARAQYYHAVRKKILSVLSLLLPEEVGPPAAAVA